MTRVVDLKQHVPLALTLSLLIYAERLQWQGGGLEHATFHVLDRAADLAGWSEERRADLFARIVEACPEPAQMMPFLTFQAAVTGAVLEHNRTWNRP